MYILKDSLRKFIYSNKKLYLEVGLLSALVFVFLYGIYILNPTYTDWLMAGGDLSQHYLGWEAFRNGTWTFPIGLTDRLAYPNYTSVMFTDSIPLFAVLFKMLSPILPKYFQYFGLWGLTCFILQGCLSARILSKFISDKPIIIISSILIILSPVMIFRMYGHTSLAGQWIILLILCPLLAYDEYKTGNKIYIDVILTAFLASATHMYLALMCGIILLGICLRDFLENKKIKRTFFILSSYIIVLLLTVWILGGFFSTGTSFTDGGLGHYSMNLNALYNPQGWSSILKDKVLYTAGQYEGFGYIGAGGLLLCIVVTITFLGNSNITNSIKTYWKSIISIAFVIIVISFVASTPVASFNDIKLYELTLPDFVTKAWGIFRACGRIVMVLPYIIIISFVIIGRKIASKRFVSILMLICFFTQLIDISNNLNGVNQIFDREVTYESPLENHELWDAIAANDNVEHIIVTYWVGENPFYALGKFAMSNGKTMNAFAMVHPNINQLLKDVEATLQEPSINEIFIFNANEWIWTRYPNLIFYDAGNYIIGYVEELSGFEHIEPVQQRPLRADFTNNLYLREGIDIDGQRTLYPGGLSYGPYWYVPVGNYKIKIEGENLNDTVNIAVYFNGGGVHKAFTIEEVTEHEIIIALSTDDDIADLEIAVENISSDNVIMNNLTIEKVQ